MNANRETKLRRAGLVSVFLALCLLLALALPREAAAASVYQPALDKLEQWGVMNGYADGDMHPERLVSRAQFVAMVNRAYGYTAPGPHPFADVADSAWYADDISIAYTAGYLGGTSANTASPNQYLTRQQAMTLLAKNLRLDSMPGEVTEFTDGHLFSGYSKGYVKAAVEKGLINGYADGTFRPTNYITRGAMAMLLQRALGTLVNQEGSYSLGDVDGNVTISTPNATLQDTTVVGNLYISGGLGLGGVTLENVRVLGEIIVAGSGESESGDDSVVLRNVEADSLQIDNLQNQYLSLRAEGNTRIEQTSIRSDAFIQDRTRSGQGLLNISLEGENNARYTLVGNLESIVNKTPNSSLLVSSGTVENLTMDEEAVGSRLTVDTNATVKNLNLDTGVPVTGRGDVDKMVINTVGSSSSMLPDSVEIRPGVTASVAGTVMNNTTAQEASADPRILAGYPKATNVAPTTATAVFSTNKPGTVYWAVSAITDGSIEEDQLVTPLTYGSKAVRSGTVRAAASGTEVAASLTGLTKGGSYYLSAVMVDSRGTHSPVKVISFETPDDTVPAFTAGPEVKQNTYDQTVPESAANKYYVQISATTNKTCDLYWAVYHTGSTAPTADDFRAGSLAGNVGAGRERATRSYPTLFNVERLEELEKYDLYVWLTDADDNKSSAVRKLSFTTVDGTRPILSGLSADPASATSIRVICTLNENGTVYWAAVKHGEDYPKPMAGSGREYPTPDQAVRKIVNGTDALKSGHVTATADRTLTITVSGLQSQTAYDIWVVGQDRAGNYTFYPAGNPKDPTDSANPTLPVYNIMVTGKTLDNIPPAATQAFSRYVGDESAPEPYPDTSIDIVFSEEVERYSTGETLYRLYQETQSASATAEELADAMTAYVDALRSTIMLYESGAGLPARVEERGSGTWQAGDPWVIDYSKATVRLGDDGETIVTFPTVSGNEAASALNLNSGTTYYFQLEDISDTSSARNRMKSPTTLPTFRTVSAQAKLDALSLATSDYPKDVLESEKETDRMIDMAFSVTPASTSQSDDDTSWDMILWSDTTAKFEMYVRSKDPRTKAVLDGWKRVELTDENGNTVTDGIGTVMVTSLNSLPAQSLHFNLYGYGVGETPALKELRDDRVYEYAIRFLEVGESTERNSWSQAVHFNISIVTGASMELNNLANRLTRPNFNSMKSSLRIDEISSPSNLAFSLERTFQDTAAPYFVSRRPVFDAKDVTVDITLQLNRAGTVFYVVAPADGTITTRNSSRTIVTKDTAEYDNVPESGGDACNEDGEVRGENVYTLYAPTRGEILEAESVFMNTELIKFGSRALASGSVTITVEGLKTETDYFAYFVIQGSGQNYSDVQLFKFTTAEASRPILSLDVSNPDVTVITDMNATLDWLLITYNDRLLRGTPLLTQFNTVCDPSVRGNYSDDYTVLDALSNYVPNETGGGYQGTVFDVYATQTEKDVVENFVKARTSGTTDTIIGTGPNIAVNRGYPGYTVNCDRYPMAERAQYIFLAIGTARPQASGYGFAAYYPLYILNTEPPYIADIQDNLTVSDKDGRKVVSGDISVTFSEGLYILESSSGATPRQSPVDNGPVIRPSGDTSGAVSIASRISYPTSSNEKSPIYPYLVDIGSGGHESPLTILNLKVTDAENRNYITFRSGFCNELGRVRNSALTIRVEIQEIPAAEGGIPTYTAKAVVTTTSWMK